MDEFGSWDVGICALNSPLAAWERTLVAGQYLPNPYQAEYDLVNPNYSGGFYPRTVVLENGVERDAKIFTEYYGVRYRQPQSYGIEGKPHHEGPSYYDTVPRLTTVAPYFRWMPNAALEIGVSWTTFFSKSRSDYRRGYDPVLQFPTLSAKWQMYAGSGRWPAVTSGFTMVTNPNIDLHKDFTRYERFFYACATERIGPIAWTLGGMNLNFLRIGGIFSGLAIRLPANVELAADWVLATYSRIPTDPAAVDNVNHHDDLDGSLTRPNQYMTLSLMIRCRRWGWRVDAGWANSLGRYSQKDNYPLARIARETRWKDLWSLLYYDPDPDDRPPPRH